MTRDERNCLLLSLLEQVDSLLHHYAISARLDYEDLRQDATVWIVRILDGDLDRIQNLEHYVTRSVHNRILNKIRYTKIRQAASLDAPLAQDSSTTLADLLPSPYRVDPLSILVAEEDIQRAMQRLHTLHPSTARMARELGATALDCL